VAEKIVFFSEREPAGLYMMDPDGSNLTRIGSRLPRPGALTPSILDDAVKRIGDGIGVAIAGLWTIDRSRVAFVHCPGLNEPAGRSSELYVMNADGSGLTNVSNHSASDVTICYSDFVGGGVDWSPDGKRLVFSSGRDPAGLYIVNADGSGLKYLTEGHYPNWSPTSDAIVFVQDFEADQFYAIHPDGSNKRLLASVPLDCGPWALAGCIAPRPRWSPDGTLLAFTAVPEPPDFSRLEAGEELNNEVFVINADGTGLRNITDRPGNDSFAIWVNCKLPLPTAGCETVVTNIQPDRLNLREGAGTGEEVVGKLSEGDIVCLLGSPALVDEFQWWPLHTSEGKEGWAAAFDPDEPDRPWLTATGRTC
jgi:hypothetical protein